MHHNPKLFEIMEKKHCTCTHLILFFLTRYRRTPDPHTDIHDTPRARVLSHTRKIFVIQGLGRWASKAVTVGRRVQPMRDMSEQAAESILGLMICGPICFL